MISANHQKEKRTQVERRLSTIMFFPRSEVCESGYFLKNQVAMIVRDWQVSNEGPDLGKFR